MSIVGSMRPVTQKKIQKIIDNHAKAINIVKNVPLAYNKSSVKTRRVKWKEIFKRGSFVSWEIWTLARVEHSSGRIDFQDRTAPRALGVIDRCHGLCVCLPNQLQSLYWSSLLYVVVYTSVYTSTYSIQVTSTFKIHELYANIVACNHTNVFRKYK